MKTQPYRGSHLPALIKLFGMTEGPVWEFGSGMYSTPFLHWACWSKQRPIVTFEGQAEWLGFIEQFRCEYHDVRFVEHWDILDLSGPCSLALIDHDAPGNVRGNELKRLTHAEYVVCHDANRPGKYGFTEAYELFKYRMYVKTPGIPIMILSNLHDLAGLTL